ncbi:TauD/TfdA family dioxygenase [Hwanghaeella grinnelliae]|uniref:TauD/TfdA family dioxygenase n=1 Tax=Hwanghaeella grinnelliae TaxID=2500179 RepID=A0A3S2VMB9_9PROT|nr:TauD/TfdA family dioxygenase [Hwanghaeella grinnelliae]RVU33857.1 TauD/TfdA family dioxygenase [Hwanghaeella grinnelliae]
MDNVDIEKLHPDFGARITGLKLGGGMTAAEVDFVHDAIDTYSFLCFPDQDLPDDDLLAFTRLLGEPEVEHVALGKTGKASFFGTIGNIGEDGVKHGNAATSTKHQTGNNLWHSDSSFRITPTYVTITQPHEVPGEGGATEFVSARAAYDRLPDEMKEKIDPLEVIHDYVFSRTQVVKIDLNHGASLPPIRHPLVRTNPRTGVKNYYTGSHARSVSGWGGIESRELLDELNAFATTPESIYSHPWAVGETVIWDNRCILHRGTGYDADRWRRLLRQTRVVGEHTGVTL